MRRALDTSLRLAAHRLRKAVGAEGYQPIQLEPSDERAETLPCRPALFDPAQIDRVRACGFKSNLDIELTKLRAETFDERPLQIARVEDAAVVGGEIFYGWQRHFMAAGSVPWRALFSIEETEGPVTLANSEQGLKYFGHWLRDDCAMFDVLHGMFAQPVLSMTRPAWPDASLYERAFGQVWDERAAFWAPSLTLVRDLGFNRQKKQQIERLRGRLRETYRPRTPGDVVYLARGASGKSRDIVNEMALRDALGARGVRIVIPEDGTADLVEALLDARVVITVEGSQAAHAVYTLALGGALLILQPPERFYNPHVEWTRLLGMDYGIVVGETREGGFQIYPEEVLAMIDRLLAAG